MWKYHAVTGHNYSGSSFLKHRVFMVLDRIFTFEPPRDKTNKMACAPSEDSDQPGHPPSLTRVFAGRTCHFVTVRLVLLNIQLTFQSARVFVNVWDTQTWGVMAYWKQMNMHPTLRSEIFYRSECIFNHDANLNYKQTENK